jgi:two-component system, OmpR family, phosphate regulon response regulator OmpR
MVVEDDEEMNELERDLLGVYGLDSVPAYTGTQALEVFDRCGAAGVHGVLLDVMLPEMDGFETCKRLRTQAGLPLPIVLLTALDSEESRRRGFEVGADAYFCKPFDPDELAHKLHDLLASRRLPGNA